jgi:hypothetical protein
MTLESMCQIISTSIYYYSIFIKFFCMSYFPHPSYAESDSFFFTACKTAPDAQLFNSLDYSKIMYVTLHKLSLHSSLLCFFPPSQRVIFLSLVKYNCYKQNFIRSLNRSIPFAKYRIMHGLYEIKQNI